MSRNKNDNPRFRDILKDISFNGCDVNGEHHVFHSIQEFARFLGVSRQTLGFWLHEDDSKRRTPDMDMLIKVSKALNMSIDYLVGLSDNNSLDADIQAVSRITGLSETAINALKDKRFQDDLPFLLNGFVEDPLFIKFARYYSHAYGKASYVTEENKSEIVQEMVDYHGGGGSFTMVMDYTLDELLHQDCGRMCSQFEDYVHRYFDLKVKGQGHTGLVHYDQAEIIESEDE